MWNIYFLMDKVDLIKTICTHAMIAIISIFTLVLKVKTMLIILEKECGNEEYRMCMHRWR